MSFKLKAIIAMMIVGCFLSLGTVLYFTFGTEAGQKKLYDMKADMIGTERVVSVYAPLGGELIKTYEDEEMRFERKPNGDISIWRGSVNKKAYIKGGVVIIDDK